MTKRDCAQDGCGYQKEALTIFVIGASGDLAKKKTYPSLFALYLAGYIPEHTIICGYARSTKTNSEFRAYLKGYLQGDEAKLAGFLQMCVYFHGFYDSVESVGAMIRKTEEIGKSSGYVSHNRLYYFAIPPTVFLPVSICIKQVGMSSSGWNRLIVEKPFGHDLESFEMLRSSIGELFSEDEIYRIDHYLGKEMVQNLMVLRFGNSIFEPLWNRHHVSSVTVTFKEDIGTQGRGGYFDQYGIIRDVMQNHLLQVLSIVAMEPPVKVAGEGYAEFVRNEKVKVLKCIKPIELENMVVGQYVASDKEVGYLDDPTVPKGSVTPTFATAVMYVDNPRWSGVPFIMKAGKALNERKAEVRVQFKKPPGSATIFPGQTIDNNELVLRLQPNEAVYMKTNVKSPGLTTTPVMSEMDLTYRSRYADADLPDAYTRLILDVLRGKQATFVRDDELQAAWEIFAPLLKRIESEKITILHYPFGSRGPKESDELVKRVGFEYHKGNYTWEPSASL